MRHGIAGRKLSRTSSHRKALFENLASELIRHEQIKTTLPKAKDLRKIFEPLITKARVNTVSARREVAKTIKDETLIKKLFDEIAPRFKETPGGYTRILKMGFRQGDSAAMALIELTEGKKATVKKKAAPKAKKDEAKVETKTEEKPAKEAKVEDSPKEEAPVETTEAKVEETKAE